MYKCKIKVNLKFFIAFLCLVLILLFIFDSKEVSLYTYEGMVFALKSIICSVFPYVFLSNLLIDTAFIENISVKISSLLQKFKINPYIIPPFAISLLCGFPIGAIYIKELYGKGLLTKTEAEILLPMCNNPSPAFVISAVGAGFLNSTLIGALIWVMCVLLSAIISFIFLPKQKRSVKVGYVNYTDYNFSTSFVESSKKTLSSSLNIGVLVAFFYLICSFAHKMLIYFDLPDSFIAFIMCLLEIGNGCMYASTCNIKAIISSFAVGFGGLCVLFQVKTNAHNDLSIRFYIFSKIVCGSLCAFFAFFLL